MDAFVISSDAAIAGAESTKQMKAQVPTIKARLFSFGKQLFVMFFTFSGQNRIWVKTVLVWRVLRAGLGLFVQSTNTF